MKDEMQKKFLYIEKIDFLTFIYIFFEKMLLHISIRKLKNYKFPNTIVV